MNVLKKILKILLAFLIVDILYFAFLKFGFFVEGWDESELMLIEFHIVCGLVYAYLGIRYLHYVRKIDFPLTLNIFFGIVFFFLGILINLCSPVRFLAWGCDLIGITLFNITEETLTQLLTVWGFCSIGTALICYETAERKYRKSQEENKAENKERIIINILKKILKTALVIIAVDIVYFAFVKFGLFVEGWDESELMLIEFHIVCGLVYAYLGIRYLHYVRKIQLSIQAYILIGIALFAASILIIYCSPITLLVFACDWFGSTLFNITDETTTQILTVEGMFSVGTALICYETAERKYRKSQEENKTENIE